MIPGLSGASAMIVEEQDLVSRLGVSGVHVLSTPRLIQLLESAAIAATRDFLPLDHLEPAADLNREDFTIGAPVEGLARLGRQQ